jgi:hypothetical protein
MAAYERFFCHPLYPSKYIDGVISALDTLKPHNRPDAEPDPISS